MRARSKKLQKILFHMKKKVLSINKGNSKFLMFERQTLRKKLMIFLVLIKCFFFLILVLLIFFVIFVEPIDNQ